MNTMLFNRRKPRKVGGEGDDHDSSETGSERGVRKSGTKPKQKSKLRNSFAPGGTSMMGDGDEEEDEEEEEVVIHPKKKLGAKSRILDSTSQRQPRGTSVSSESLAIRTGSEDDRPSYSREYLQELRNSTPSTPQKMMSAPTSDDERDKALDVTGKFGELTKTSRPSAIPSEAEIREKKERRARLAQEEDYISLNDVEDEDEDDDLTLSKKEETTDTRLVRDDEDFAEGFDDFVEDGRISLGKKAEREQQRRHRAEMKELIEGAGESSASDDSETERRAAYEAAQTRAGMDGLSKKHLQEPSRPKTPPKISSIPRLASCLAELQSSLSNTENSKLQLVQRLEQLRQEKVEISTREVEIQNLLKEAGENYEKLRAEAGASQTAQNLLPGSDVQANRGLESLGTVALPAPENASGEED